MENRIRILTNKMLEIIRDDLLEPSIEIEGADIGISLASDDYIVRCYKECLLPYADYVNASDPSFLEQDEVKNSTIIRSIKRSWAKMSAPAKKKVIGVLKIILKIL